MKGYTPQTKQWELAGGLVARGCAGERCGALAAVVIRDVNEAKLPLCTEHWRATMRSTHGCIETIQRLERPHCFRADCADEATAIMEHLDGTPLPVCQRHWDDLSWVEPESPGSQALLDENLVPKWDR